MNGQYYIKYRIHNESSEVIHYLPIDIKVGNTATETYNTIAWTLYDIHNQNYSIGQFLIDGIQKIN